MCWMRGEVESDVALAEGGYDESNVCEDDPREATVAPVAPVAAGGPVTVAADTNDDNRDSAGVDVAASPEDRVATVTASDINWPTSA